MKKMTLLVVAFINLLAYDSEELKTNLHTRFKEKLPKTLCRPAQVYMKCYAVKEEECRMVVEETSEFCWKKMETRFDGNKSVNEFVENGRQFGMCVELLYRIALTKLGKADKECLQDPKWQE